MRVRWIFARSHVPAVHSAVFAPHIIMRPADTEYWHRKADVAFISLLFHPVHGLEVDKDLVEVERKKPASCIPTAPDPMTRTVRFHSLCSIGLPIRPHHVADKLTDGDISLACGYFLGVGCTMDIEARALH